MFKYIYYIIYIYIISYICIILYIYKLIFSWVFTAPPIINLPYHLSPPPQKTGGSPHSPGEFQGNGRIQFWLHCSRDADLCRVWGFRTVGGGWWVGWLVGLVGLVGWLVGWWILFLEAGFLLVHVLKQIREVFFVGFLLDNLKKSHSGFQRWHAKIGIILHCVTFHSKLVW